MIRDDQHQAGFADDLYQMLQASSGSCFAFASPQKGSGVVQCVNSLAQRAATSGRQILIVDMDLLSPTLHTAWEIDQVEWWPTDHASITAAITVSDNISVLPAPDLGGAHVAFRERSSLSLAVSEWKKKFDMVLIISPPLLGGEGDQLPTGILCNVVDSNILVVKGGVTTISDLQAATLKVKESGGEILGSVLNDSENQPLLFEITRTVEKYLGRFPRISNFLQQLVTSSIILRSYK